MRDRRKASTPSERLAVNEEIQSAQVRVIDQEGNQLGVLKLEDALKRAEEGGTDLVEVAPQGDPPVCRLLDYGKYKYREQKKAAEARKKTAMVSVKEIRVRYNTDEHDLQTKLRNARKFLQAGDRVRFQMRFRGREIVYKKLGEEIFKRIITDLDTISAVEESASLTGSRMIMTLAPK